MALVQDQDLHQRQVQDHNARVFDTGILLYTISHRSWMYATRGTHQVRCIRSWLTCWCIVVTGNKAFHRSNFGWRTPERSKRTFLMTSCLHFRLPGMRSWRSFIQWICIIHSYLSYIPKVSAADKHRKSRVVMMPTLSSMMAPRIVFIISWVLMSWRHKEPGHQKP